MSMLLRRFFFLALALLTRFQARCQDDGRTINIPVTFHVLYGDSTTDNGTVPHTSLTGNSSMYVPRAKLEVELADLDRDCQKLNADVATARPEFRGVAGNANVHFYLKEIKYMKVDKARIMAPYTNTDLLHELSPSADSKTTLNVYVSTVKYHGQTSSGLTPVSTSRAEGGRDDVVNLTYEWVGQGYRLLTHEVGHWLGLWHTWDTSQARDGIADIPLQRTFTDIDCDSCPPKVKDRLRPGTGFAHSNYHNFMDYSGCRVMFSADQTKKIRAVILNNRPEIWQNSVRK